MAASTRGGAPHATTDGATTSAISAAPRMSRKAIGVIAAAATALAMLAVGTAANANADVTNTAAGATVRPVDNMGFESGLDGWTAKGDVQTVEGGASEGDHYADLAAGASITRTITGIPQGSYSLNLNVKGSASRNTANLTVSDTGGPNSVLKLDAYLKAGQWTATSHRNVLVYNGQMTVTITAGGSALAVDALNLQLDSDDSNTVSNWDFEQGTDGWTTTGDVTVADKTDADTGSKAMRLGAGATLAQTVKVTPNTKYVLTARTKVARQDTFSTETHSNWRGQDGLLVNRESTGDRINIGVKGADGTVLRQAPSGTTGYSLVSVVFTTGNTDEVTVYANTVHDEAYTKSVTLHNSKGTYVEDPWTGNGQDGAWVDNLDLFAMHDANVAKGADVSFLPVIEDKGGKYFANGVQQDCLNILANHGVNSITNMIFVQAGNDTYTSTANPQKMYQSWNGPDGNPMPYRMVQGGYFDKEHSAELGVRATELGMSYLPSFHYSDSWISAAKAYTPLEWLNKAYDGTYSNSDLKHMKAIVYNYVHDFMTELVDRHVNLAGVKTGNEQDGGLIRPVAQGATSEGHAAIITASYEAIKDVAPGIPTYVHTNNGYDPTYAFNLYEGLSANGAEYDGEAHSLYGGRSSGNIIKFSNAMNTSDAHCRHDYVNVEAGYSFTRYKATFDQQTSQMTQAAYDGSPNGQYNWLLDYMQAPLDAANPYGRTRGFYYWETDWIPTPGAASADGSSADVNQRIMFNNGDPNIKEMGSAEAGKAGDMMDSMYAYLIRGVAKTKTADVTTPLSNDNGYADGRYEVTPAKATAIGFDESELTLTAGGMSRRLQPTVQPTGAVLSDDAIAYGSSDPSVATVSPQGFVTGVKAGTATVTATIGGAKATARVTVKDATEASADDLTVTVGGKQVHDGDVVAAKALDHVDMSAALADGVSDRSVAFTSSDTDVATFFGETWQTAKGRMEQRVDDGSVVQLDVKNAGSTKVTVTSADGKASLTFTVDATKTPVESVTLDKTDPITLSHGRSTQLKATVNPKDATLYKVTWSSSDPDAVSVDQDGNVTAVGEGDATVTVTSDDNPDAKASVLVHAVPVQVEGVSLGRDRLTLQQGSAKRLDVLVTPDDADDKSVTWKSDDPSIASVAADGTVTGHAIGETTVTVTTVNGGYTDSLVVKVQKDAVAATGVTLDRHEVWLKSDAFSEQPDGKTATVQLTAAVTPDDATETDVDWTSSDESVATVNAFGIVTAVKPGVAVITATTKDGKHSDKATVYVPTVSESFDNRDAGSNAGFGRFANYGGQLGAKVVDGSVDSDDASGHVLEISGGGSGGRATSKTFATAVSNDKVVFDADWNVGAPAGSKGAFLTLVDGSNHRYLSLQTNAGTELVYATGGQSSTKDTNSPLTDATAVGSGFDKNDTWYNVHVELDFAARKITFTVTSKSDAKLTATHTVPFAEGVDYDGSLAGIQLWGTRGAGTLNWTTRLDNLAVYAAQPTASAVKPSATTVKLVPIKDTLSATRKVTATVEPAGYSQDVTYTSLNPDIITVSADGVIAPVTYYDGLDAVKPAKATVRVASKQSPNVYADIAVEITNTPGASEFFVVTDGDGNDLTGGKANLNVGDTLALTAKSTGGDGDVLLKSVEWTTNAPKVAQVDKTTGVVKALAGGTATIHVKATLYNSDKPLEADVEVTVTGDAPAAADGIAVTKQPAKTAYVIGDRLDTTGLEVSETVGGKTLGTLADDQYEVSGFDADLPGDKTVTVTSKAADTAGKTATFTVTVTDPTLPGDNLLANGGFENDLDSWTPTWNQKQGSVRVKAQNKANNLHEGKKSLDAWNASAMDFTMEQQVTGLAEGWYVFSGWLTGDTGKNDDIRLYAKSVDGSPLGDAVRAELPGQVNGGYEWKNPTMQPVHVGEDGVVTVGFSVKQDGGGWAVLDDFSLVRVDAPDSAVTGLTLVSGPTKTEYAKGEELSTDGIAVRRLLEGGTTAPLSATDGELTYSGYDPSKPGTQTVTVSMAVGGDAKHVVSATFEVTVKDDATPDPDPDKPDPDKPDPSDKDTTAPVFTGVDDATIEVGAAFDPLAGVSAKDDVDGDLTGSITVEGAVDTATAGEYRLTYTVSDKAGNKATAKRTVTVKAKDGQSGTDPDPDKPGTDKPGTDKPGTDNPGTDNPGGGAGSGSDGKTDTGKRPAGLSRTGASVMGVAAFVLAALAVGGAALAVRRHGRDRLG
ncbi:Ig-like domain-containing protein [Bifidobacterium saguinibicoloris]|uniref:Ig-like domain-containing protein n=1 Tax=Bifidobacterium saguinibicoloris TaxID=2834433 RepID=UPI00308420B6